MRKVLSVLSDEFLQPLIALLFIGVIQHWHLEGVVELFDLCHAGLILAAVASLWGGKQEKIRSGCI